MIERHGINSFPSSLSVIFNLSLNSACSTTFSVISLSLRCIYLNRLLSPSSSFQHPLWSCIPVSPISLSPAISFISQRRAAFLLELLFLSLSLSVSEATLLGTWRRRDRSEELFIAEQGRKVTDNLRVTRMPGDIPGRF